MAVSDIIPILMSESSEEGTTGKREAEGNVFQGTPRGVGTCSVMFGMIKCNTEQGSRSFPTYTFVRSIPPVP